jgi:hypothetical protein
MNGTNTDYRVFSGGLHPSRFSSARAFENECFAGLVCMLIMAYYRSSFSLSDLEMSMECCREGGGEAGSSTVPLAVYFT